jgi:single-stranded DNA-binding protein
MDEQGAAQQSEEAAEPIVVEVCGRLAELCGRYLVEGSLVLIDGQLRPYGFVEQNSQQREFSHVQANHVMPLEWHGHTEPAQEKVVGVEDLPFSCEPAYILLRTECIVRGGIYD